METRRLPGDQHPPPRFPQPADPDEADDPVPRPDSLIDQRSVHLGNRDERRRPSLLYDFKSEPVGRSGDASKRREHCRSVLLRRPQPV